uniref:AtRLP43 (Receptor Like Protein 43) n=1 Tax=Arundo donax TaxID=35708 RepID=A0A0A9FHJ7_ARUDO
MLHGSSPKNWLSSRYSICKFGMNPKKSGNLPRIPL